MACLMLSVVVISVGGMAIYTKAGTLAKITWKPTVCVGTNTYQHTACGLEASKTFKNMLPSTFPHSSRDKFGVVSCRSKILSPNPMV